MPSAMIGFWSSSPKPSELRTKFLMLFLLRPDVRGFESLGGWHRCWQWFGGL